MKTERRKDEEERDTGLAQVNVKQETTEPWLELVLK